MLLIGEKEIHKALLNEENLDSFRREVLKVTANQQYIMEGLQIVHCQIQSMIVRTLHFCVTGRKVKIYAYLKS